MQFIDLAAQQQRIKGEINTRIQTVLAHGKYIMGPEVTELEEALAQYVGSKHALACASGTDALLLAMMALGVRPGDAIFTTPFTFISTAEVVSLLGAIPVFVDIDQATFNLDPAQLKLAMRAVNEDDPSIYPLPNPRTSNPGRPQAPKLNPRGIIAVDLFGLPADYDRLNAIAQRENLFVIEDAAQSFGAKYRGKTACSLTQTACTSFFPAKPLGGYGDGGMCFTTDDGLLELLQSLRIHGKGHHKYDNVRIGINGRLDTLQAAILLAKFDIFPEEIELRQQAARRYTERLADPAKEIVTPTIPSDCLSAWAQYSIMVRDTATRQALQNKMKQAAIPSAIYYPLPLHLQGAFSYLGYKEGDFPTSEDCAQRIFSLPMHPYLEKRDQEMITKLLLAPDSGA
jgi:dTDP-4-amino-4,6-dideoxygalactose transaminase